MSLSRFTAGIFSAGLVIVGTGVVCGQEYPNRPIRIVTAAAGGGSDFTARQVAQGISGPLGQPVIVENRGSGIVQYEFLSKAPPDGYGLLVTGSAFYVFPLMQKVPYDVVNDYSPIALLVRDVFVFAVHPSVPATSIRELIALAKAKPGALNYASTVSGGPGHLAMELFKSMAGVNIVNVAYKGSAAGVTAVLSGEVQMAVYDASAIAPHVKSGKLRALAVTNAEPSPLVPGVLTVSASGLPGYEMESMTGIYAPGKTPAAIINRLNQEIVRALNRTDVKERFSNAGVEVVASSPEQFTATLKSEMAKWGKVIKDAGIKAD